MKRTTDWQSDGNFVFKLQQNADGEWENQYFFGVQCKERKQAEHLAEYIACVLNAADRALMGNVEGGGL